MSIDTEHEEYCEFKAQWQLLRDCYAGQAEIQEAGTKYLPKLSGQSNEEYNAYLKRPAFYNATGRTVDGLSGMVFRKPPQVDVPDGMKPFLDDVTLSGLDLQGFAEAIIDDDIIVGRAGILVDHPTIAGGTTKAQAEANNIRPFLKHYTAENIFNWKIEGRNNKQVLTQVRLWEYVEVRGESEFDVDVKKQIRVLDFDDQGRYRQRVFIKVKMPVNGEEWVQNGPDIIPLMRGAALNFIPFFFVGVKNGSGKIEKPPLIDLANVNISHFQSSADLEHGAHFTGLPTAVITGHQDETDGGQTFKIGSATAWVFPNPETKAAFLEFTGQGLEALEKRCAKKEEQMAMLGARMLTPDKKAVEAQGTAEIYRSGETSVLSSLAQSAGQSIEAALKLMSDWAGFGDKVVFKFNNEFLAVSMDAQKLTALLQLWQGRAIAFQDLLDNLKRGEIVNEERTADDIKSEAEQENPFTPIDITTPVIQQ